MTTFDINARFGETASRPVRTNPVARWFAHWRHRRRQRLTLTELHRRWAEAAGRPVPDRSANA